MNRRSFIKSIIGIAGLVLAEPDIDKLLENSKELNDSDFVEWIQISFQIYVQNPRMCAYINGISES